MAAREESHVEWPQEPTDHLTKMFNGFRSTLVVTSACEMGLFDKVSEHVGGVRAEALAEQHGWHVDNTRRLMDAMTAHKLLIKHSTSAIYENSESGNYLLSDKKGSFRGVFIMFSKMLMKSMPDIAEEVKTGAKSGKPHWHDNIGSTEEVSDRKQADEHHEQPPRDKGNSHYLYNVMEAMMLPYVNHIVTTFDLSKYKSAVDIGGGTGLLSYTMSRQYPDMKITVVEMASVIKIAKEHFKPDDSDQLNVDFLEGDCFELDLPNADLYMLSKIVHHFTEAQMDELFTKLYNKLTVGGSVMLLEDTFNKEKTDNAVAHCFDLMMMSKGIGRNRSFDEYAHILERNNFNRIKCVQSNEESMYDIILATKS